LTTGRGLLAVTSWFGFGSGSSWPVVSGSAGPWPLFTRAGSTRTLRAGTARANAGPNSGFAANATEEAGPWLFNYFDLRVVAVHAQVDEGSIGRLFD
jgi:hypothetical protein